MKKAEKTGAVWRTAFKVVITIVCSAGLLYLYMLLAGYMNQRELGRIKEHEAFASGQVAKIGNMKGRYILVEFFVKGKRYEARSGIRERDEVDIGQPYVVRYDSTDPTTSRIVR